MKRWFDVSVVVLMLPWVLPVLLLLSLVVVCTSPGGAFYCQMRMGQRRKPFRLIKLRTMIVNADRQGLLLTVANDPRMTRVGAWLRASKLDELPQLWHVLMGDMSLVGPRPEVPCYASCFYGDGVLIHNVRPGLMDTASWVFACEGALLTQCLDPDEAYRGVILPAKIQLSLHDIRCSSVGYDLRLMIYIVAAMLGWGARRREHPILADVRAQIELLNHRGL